MAVRFHHRLVQIHPFANGNGRHSRLAADLLAVELGSKPFTWGGNNLAAAGEIRARYIQALRLADQNPDDLTALLTFARS
ncbi:MAG: Fic family protein [Verrucomicrobiales bacterium]|nr:Fic family protein [Verrucomicrobiales bacterium]